MNTEKNGHLQILKITIVCTIIIIASMIGVRAGNIKVNDVTIKLTNNSELNVMTSKTKVSEILEENHIILSEDEKVIPNLEEELTENRTIQIAKSTNEVEIAVEASDENTDEILNNILASYAVITEKIIVEQVEIPFETITKDVSEGSANKENKVIQAGQNGLKEVTYKVKYRNDVEIDRVQISEVIIKEPVDKIIQVNKVQISSRSSSGSRVAVTGSKAEYQAYAKQRCKEIGWSDNDFNCLVSLWNRESGWNPTACNRSSGAYGIPQALPASKMAAYGSDYLTNYKTQINWGLGYIKGRYGSPSNAWSHFQRKGWY